ncbi:MAG TPA: GAF domain-containing protein [Thermomicrobiales bacterium]|nr:GAF domain-containing protein [Thermomicrobiales bacterium]
MRAGSTSDPAARRRASADAARRATRLLAAIEALGGEAGPEALPARVVAGAVVLLDAAGGALGLVDDTAGGPVVRVAAVAGRSPLMVGAEMPAGEGLIGRALRDERPRAPARRGQLAGRAAVAAPLWWDGAARGVLALAAAPGRRFTAADGAMLARFARHAAGALAQARRYERERRRAERLALIARVNRLVTAGLEPDDLLATAAAAIHELLGYPYVAIALADPADPGDLVLRGVAGPYRHAAPVGYRLPRDAGITAAAVRERRVLLVDDVAADPRHFPTPGATGIRAELAVPIARGDDVFGVVNVEGGEPFTAEDAESLAIIADQLASALANARLFAAARRRAARLATVARVGQLIAGRLSLDHLLQTAVEAIHEHLAFPHVAILLVDPADPAVLVRRARSGMYTGHSVLEYRQRLGDGILGAAARDRRPLLVNDVRQDPRYIAVPGGEAIRAELAAPLLSGDTLLGALNVESERPIGDEDATALLLVADQLGIALENARLFAGTRQALEGTRLLYETSLRINTALTMDEVIAAYLDEVAARGHYRCTIALYDTDDAGARTAVTVRGHWAPAAGAVLLAETVPYTPDGLDAPLDAGHTVAIADVHADPRVSAKLREMQAADGRPTLAMIPLMARGQRLGLVILSSPAAHAWPAADLQLYEATAAQLATALDRCRQHELLTARGRQVAVLEERQRLARDLHDSVTQHVFSLTLIAQALAPAWRRDPAEGERRVARLLEVSQAALGELRALLAELRPADPAPPPGAAPASGLVCREGLPAALRRHLADVARGAGAGLELRLDATGYAPQPPDHEEALFRIAQEALHNVVKHARARRVTIRLGVEGDLARLAVADDGVGFAAASGGFGLRIMQERAAALGGVAEVTSAPGCGTTVAARLPRQDGER